ncbi:MAG: hypothetical protein EAZ85_04510 [Bacteroidetes bacterium]|nr:MAG: hypothetical protein EAZ85_04510 [Bacteroidota bacterium]TAG90726.1 MAG: hypothetical protein EAZ20_03830 [Bacteroidota bacterium]
MKKIQLIINFILIICFLSNCGSKNDASPESEGFFIKLLGAGNSDEATEFFLDSQDKIIGLATQSFKELDVNKISPLLFRTDKFGNQTLMKRIAGIQGNTIRPTADGGVIILSGSKTALSNTDYFFVIKLKADDSVEWTKSFAPTNANDDRLDILGSSIEQVSDGYIISISSKYTIPTLNQEYVYLWKIDNTGNLLRSTYFGDPATTNRSSKSRALANNDVVMAGSYNQYMRIMLSNSLGSFKWDYALYHPNSAEKAVGNDVQIANAGFVVGGTITKTTGETDGLVIKTNSDGKIEWQSRFGGENNQRINSITNTPDGGYVVTGTTDVVFKGTLNDNIWVVKLNSSGNVEWQKDFGSPKDDVGSCVRVASNGNIVVLGTVIYETTPMLALIELTPNGETKK